MSQEFIFGALIIVAGLIFFWRMRKSIQLISIARAEKKKAPLLEWAFIFMGIFLLVVFGLRFFGVI
jgi:lipid-A-disaccharide synthase-like uncharacterized protein